MKTTTTPPMKMNQWFTAAAVIAVLCVNAGNLFSQNGAPPQGGFGGGNFNFDPAQIQKYMMDAYREQLEIKDDGEWKIVEERIQKVTDARREVGFGGMGMMGGMMRRGGANGGPPGGAGGGGRRGFGAFAPTPNPDEEALQKAIDAKAPNAEIKAALAKWQESKKARQAALEKAQANLRQVLSVRQEAVAALAGLL